MKKGFYWIDNCCEGRILYWDGSTLETLTDTPEPCWLECVFRTIEEIENYYGTFAEYLGE